MPAPYTPRIEVNAQHFFPAPYSLDPLPSQLRRGLIPVGVSAVVSVALTLSLVVSIIYPLVTSKARPGNSKYNQYVLLVLNLLLADLQQSAAFLISFHWIHDNRILAPTRSCFAQAWLLHSGNLSSGFFVLAIALHTFSAAVPRHHLKPMAFNVVIVLIWGVAYFLTGLGVALHGDRYFVRAGAWCWVSEAYESERLALHYIWLFFVQFGTVIIYIVVFCKLRLIGKLPSPDTRDANGTMIQTQEKIKRVTKVMMLFPSAYILLTLPLSTGRMWSMAHGGQPYSDVYACVAGAMITSCGWVDALLYTVTRKRLLKDTMSRMSNLHWGGIWRRNVHDDASLTSTRQDNGQMMEMSPFDLKSPAVICVQDRTPSPSGNVDPILNKRHTAG